MRFRALIGANVIVVGLVAALMADSGLPLYPEAVIIYALLLSADLALIFASKRDLRGMLPRARGVPASLWIACGLFTPAGTAAVIAYVRSPTMPLGVQALVAVILVVSLWLLLIRAYRGR